MITNERQHRITKAEAARFRRALREAEEQPTELSPRMHQVVLDGMRSQLSDLEREIEEFDAVRSGRVDEIEMTSILDLPKILIMARIASQLTQAELADRLGIHEQQIQRYEATSYTGASLTRLVETADALGLSIAGMARLPQPAASERHEALSSS